jgi:heme/copper-type cytochrome/quinol oxidase subunit 3
MFFFFNTLDSFSKKDFLRIENDKLNLFMELNRFSSISLKNKLYILRHLLHYYNDIFFTRWPFFLSMGVFFFIFGVILSLSKVFISMLFLFFGLISIFVYLFNWFNELYLENRLLGKHTLKIKGAILFGFFLFLCSEATLFAGFFWSLLDRVFSASSFVSFSSLPAGLDRIQWFGDPLRATLVLVCSGYMANLSYYYLLDRNYLFSDLYWGASIFLGVLFLYIQYCEYSHLINDIRDSVWYSHMYLLTGFHGLHVIIGLCFLSYHFQRKVINN